MKITPLDIQQQQFKGKMFGGLDPEDVDTFLQMVAQEMEELARENNELKELSRKAAAEAEELANRERDLRDTMIGAQKVTEEMAANAQKEASLKITEAELKAERLLADAEQQLAALKNEILELRRQKLQFEMAFKSLLDTHYKLLTLDDQN